LALTWFQRKFADLVKIKDLGKIEHILRNCTSVTCTSTLEIKSQLVRCFNFSR